MLGVEVVFVLQLSFSNRFSALFLRRFGAPLLSPMFYVNGGGGVGSLDLSFFSYAFHRYAGRSLDLGKLSNEPLVKRKHETLFYNSSRSELAGRRSWSGAIWTTKQTMVQAAAQFAEEVEEWVQEMAMIVDEVKEVLLGWMHS